MADISKVYVSSVLTNIKDDSAINNVKLGEEIQTKTNGVVSLPSYPTTLPASDTIQSYDGTSTHPVSGAAVSELISNYYTKSQVNNLTSKLPTFTTVVVDELPTDDISTTTIYMLRSSEAETLYTLYIYQNEQWVEVGKQESQYADVATQTWVTNQDYATKTWVDANAGVIKTIKVNGTAQQIVDRAVDITMPTKVSELTNDSEYATKSYADESNKIESISVNGTSQTIDENKNVNLTVPTKVTDLTDAGNYETTSALNTTLGNYYKKTETYTQTEIDNKISAIPKFGIKVVDELPETGEENKLYLVKVSNDIVKGGSLEDSLNISNAYWQGSDLATLGQVTHDDTNKYGVATITDTSKATAWFGSNYYPIYDWCIYPMNLAKGDVVTQTLDIETSSASSLCLAIDLYNNSTGASSHQIINLSDMGVTFSSDEFTTATLSYTLPDTYNEIDVFFMTNKAVTSGTVSANFKNLTTVKDPIEPDIFEEYVYVDDEWKMLGAQSIDLSGYVPTKRTVNGHTLTQDITLTSSDVGALGTNENASSSSKLNISDIGSATQPVYFKDGVPVLANTYPTVPTVVNTYSSTSTNPISGKGVASALSSYTTDTLSSYALKTSVPNITVSTDEPSSSTGSYGDLWLVVSE